MERGTVLVTGAAGLVGRHVGQQLAAANIKSILTDVSPEARLLDIRDQSAVKALFDRERIDAVIHLAGILNTAAQHDPRRAVEINLVGSANLLDAAAAAGVRRFVFGSSTAVYGAHQFNTPLSEEVRYATNAEEKAEGN